MRARLVALTLSAFAALALAAANPDASMLIHVWPPSVVFQTPPPVEPK